MSPDWQIRAALGVMVLYFGSSFTAYAAAEESFGFVTINVGRFVLASVILLVISRGRLATVRHVRGRLLLAGGYGVGVMAILMAFGVDRATPTLASLVMALESPGIAVAAAFVARDRPTRAAILSLLIGFAGSAIASGAITEPPSEVPFLAVAALLGAVISFSVYAATIRRTAPSADPLAVATVVQIGAAMFAAPLLLLDVLDRGIVRDPPDAAAIISVVVIGAGSALGYWLMSSVLARASASRFAVSMYLLPVVGVTVAWIALGDAPYARHLVGGALILGAVWVSERAASRVPRPA
jgi:drug/metabolite transporter (DMT)-like permease